MATDKQIAANRANAQKSTGPRTVEGRRRAARNALRYGLSVPRQPDPAARDQMFRLADSILNVLGNVQEQSALEFAAAQLELEHIRKVRSDIMRHLNWEAPTPKEIWRLSSIDRYEHEARRRRQRAVKQTADVGLGPDKTKPNSTLGCDGARGSPLG